MQKYYFELEPGEGVEFPLTLSAVYKGLTSQYVAEELAGLYGSENLVLPFYRDGKGDKVISLLITKDPDDKPRVVFVTGEYTDVGYNPEKFSMVEWVAYLIRRGWLGDDSRVVPIKFTAERIGGEYGYTLDYGTRVGSSRELADYLGEEADQVILASRRWWEAILLVIESHT